MMISPILWADILLVFHFAYALCLIVPVPLIVMGEILKWSFVRNSWFRNLHLAGVGLLVGQTVSGLWCPLTVWEQRLRSIAGDPVYSGSFIQYWVGKLLYYDFSWPLFAISYLTFGLVILLLYILFPPRCFWRRRLSKLIILALSLKNVHRENR